MKKIKLRKTIPNLLTAANETNDIQETINYENKIACMFASPIMFIGVIVNFILGYFVMHGDIRSTLINSLIFLVLGILFEIFMRIQINVEWNSCIISILYALWFLFILNRLYQIVGPAVWMIACIQIVFAMSRIKKNMAIIIGTVTFLASLYVMFNSADYQFQLNYFYFIPQSVLLIILILVASIVSNINTSRFFKLRNQLQLVIEQKNDITALYEEIAATEEELRQQNQQLITYTEEIKKSDEKLSNLAYFDILTGLPNRKMFMEQLDLLIEKSKEQKTVFYFIFIDVDSFKKINDTMGHDVGDKFIELVAQRLKGSIHKRDLLGRIGGDEFALIISRDLSEAEVLQEIEAVRNNFSQTVRINNADIRSTASFGISHFPQDGKDALEMLKSADLSMYKAKEMGKNNVQFFKRYMQDEIVQKTEMENRLIYALKNEEFFLVFQPQYCVTSEKIRGLEALVRWKSPELGIVSPMQFIPLAEEIGLIVPLGEWILKMSCYKFKKLQEQYGLNALISVNISAVQIKDINFIEVVKNVLNETGLDPKYLELEVTESVFIESLNQAIQLLKELKKLGVRIALDDFGTGYSSLSYLKILPIDTLKIDQSFVKDLSADGSQVQFLGDIISLAHNLGVTVIAEGVEYAHQMDYLKNHSCDYVQGFLLERPLAEEALRVLLESNC